MGPTPAPLEREADLRAIDDVLTRAVRREGSALCVVGEPGIGKTALLSQARERAAAHGLGVLFARGSSHETLNGFGLARRLFGAGTSGDEKRPRTEAAVMSDLWAALADLTSSRGPLVVAVDDAHWCDGPSLRFLSHVAVRISELPVLLLIAARPDEPGEATNLLADLASGPEVEVCTPRPLSEEAVAELTSRHLGDVDPAVSAACFRATQGNPFYVQELLRALANEGGVRVPESIARIAPPSVLRSVMVRLARLGPDETALARAVSVLGDSSPLLVCSELAGLPEGRAESAADALARAHIFAPGDPVGFAHPLIGATVESDIGAFERSRLHRQAADILLAHGRSADVVAGHLVDSRPNGDRAVVGVLQEAAAIALNHGDSASAVRLLERALLEPPPPQARAGVLTELAEVEAMVGVDSATDHLEEALDLIVEPIERATILGRLSLLLHSGGHLETAADLARRGAAELADQDPALSERLLGLELGADLLVPDRHGEAVARVDQLLAEVQQGYVPKDPGLSALIAAHAALEGEEEHVVALARRAYSDDPLIDDSHGNMVGWLGCALVWADALREASAWLDSAVEAAERRGDTTALAVAAYRRSEVLFHMGELDRAIADAERARAMYRHGWGGSPWSVPVLATALAARGDLDAAHAVLAEPIKTDELSPDLGLLLEARAKVELMRGDFDGALQSARQAGQMVEGPQGSLRPRLWEWRRHASVALTRLGRRQEALAVVTPDLEILRERGPSRQLGSALTAAGLATEGDAGIDLLREAVQTLSSSPSVMTRLDASLELGAALRAVEARAEATSVLYDVLEQAGVIGAGHHVQRAKSELRRLGARPRRSARTGVGALTPSERVVAGLAAEGLTTTAIAQRLTLSPHTIETHLRHVYRKLDISGRGSLASALARAGAPARPGRT